MSALAEHALRLQRDIHTALNADTALQNVMGRDGEVRAYDEVPPEPTYPYLTYGRTESRDASADETVRTTHAVTLHVWSRATSRAEALELLRQVEAALDTHLPHRSVPTLTDIFRAPDGRTRHGLLRLSVILEDI